MPLDGTWEGLRRPRLAMQMACGGVPALRVRSRQLPRRAYSLARPLDHLKLRNPTERRRASKPVPRIGLTWFSVADETGEIAFCTAWALRAEEFSGSC